MQRRPTLALLAFLLSVPPAAGADFSPSTVDEAVRPAETFEEERRLPSLPSEEPPEIVLEEETAPPVEDGGPEFLIRNILFEGNTLVPESEFRQYVEPFENRKTTFRRLREFTQIVTNHYRALGYTTSRAYLAPQTVADNTVTVKVIEGKIDKIHVEGNKHFGAHVYRDAIRLRSDRIFRYQDLETSLYFLNQLPDRKVKAYLLAGAEPVSSDIILKVEDKRPVHMSYEFSNRGTNLTHHTRHTTSFTNYNATGAGDTFFLSSSNAEEGAFNGYSASYARPVGNAGSQFLLDANWADTALVKNLKRFEVEGHSRAVTPGILLNFVREPARSVDWYAGFEIKDSKTDVDDSKISFDRMRVLKTGPRLLWQGPSERTTLGADAHVGIPSVLGGSSDDDVNTSRAGSSGQFAYFTANWTRTRKIPLEGLLFLRANGQWSPDTLTSVELFRAGGAYSVRGYPESDASGDLGWTASAEAAFPFPIPREWRVPFMKKKRWKDSLRWVSFFDLGKTYNVRRFSSTDVKDKFLMGAGLGLRVNLDRTFALQCDFGFPLGDDSSEKDRTQTHVSVRAGF